MSINSAMLAGVSGLVANSSALAAISDNIANINTVAYKRNQVNFQTAVTSQALSGRYSAGGVLGQAHQYVSQQGLVQSASSPTDLAIAGEGMFVVAEKGRGLTASDARLFTRSGAFTVDADGFLVNSAGFYLQGWLADSTGAISVNPSDLTRMSSINVKDQSAVVAKTANVVVESNFDKSQTISAGEAAYVGTTATSMADYANDPTTGTKPDFTVEMNVIDSTGGSRRIALSVLKDATTNRWNAEIYAIPASEVTGAGRPGQIASGLIAFNADGSLDMANTTLFGAAGSPAVINLAASGAAGTPRWANSMGIQAQTIALDLSKMTQYSAANTAEVNPDGAGVGNVISVEVSEDGIVSAIYDNSEIRRIAQIGIATFPNYDGLRPVTGNAYRPTTNSGEFSLKVAGIGGAGKVAASALEASTVDLSSEFTGLITTQKAYSASSKIITTADQMLDELINIRR